MRRYSNTLFKAAIKPGHSLTLTIAVLMGVLAVVFALMTVACWGHLVDLLQASR